MRELGSGTTYNTHNTTSLIRTLKYVSDILQTEEAFTVKGYKHTHTHTYVLNRWPQTTVVEYLLCIGPAKYTKASPPARKMSLFSSIIITIILSYAIIRIYTILHIYLQVSETGSGRTALNDRTECIRES